VHAAGGGVDAGGKLVAVGRLQLGQSPVLEQHLRQRIVLGELLQHFLVGRRRAAGGLLRHRQLQHTEQDLADLLRAAEVERLAGQLLRPRLELRQPMGDLDALRRQPVAVDQHADALHLEQDLRHRHLDRLVDLAQLRQVLQPRPQRLVQGSVTSASSAA
jgi:hypothetical protein